MALYLRRWLAETPIFQEMKQQKALAKELPLKTVVVNHKEAIVISMLLTWLLSAGVVVVILLTPAYLQTEFGLAKAVVSVANMTAILALCAGVWWRVICVTNWAPLWSLPSAACCWRSAPAIFT